MSQSFIRLNPDELDGAGYEALRLAADLEQVIHLLGAIEFGGFPSDIAARSSGVRDIARQQTRFSVDTAREQAPALRGRASRARDADRGGMPWDAFGWIETFRSQALTDLERLERETGLSADSRSISRRLERVGLGRRLPHLTKEQVALRYMLLRDVGPYASKMGVRGYPRLSAALERSVAHLPPTVLKSAQRLAKLYGPAGTLLTYLAAKSDGRSTLDAAAKTAVSGAVGGASAWAIGSACAAFTSETGIGPLLCFAGAALGGGALGSAAGDAYDEETRGKRRPPRAREPARPYPSARFPIGWEYKCHPWDQVGREVPELRPAPVRPVPVGAQ